jgi:FkbM family methyltransferase
MRRALQNKLLRLYSGVQSTGLLSTAGGQALFEKAYWFYKEWFEAGAVDQLQPLVTPGSTVVDIGANVGFFTRRFASWTGPEGRVLAIEPEAENFRRLKLAMVKGGFGCVETIRSAVGESTGTARLQLNPSHPADHRLANQSDNEGVEVPLIRLDDLLATRGWPTVSLVKIDVQGAEQRVLMGAEETLARVRPAWFVEVDDDGLRAMGSSAASLIDRFIVAGYDVRRLGRDGIGPSLDPAQVLRQIRPGNYEDLLFTPGLTP